MSAAASEQKQPSGRQSSDSRPGFEEHSVLSMRTQDEGKRDYTAIAVFVAVLAVLTASGVYFSLNLERDILGRPLQSISRLVEKASRYGKSMLSEFDKTRRPRNEQSRLAQKHVRRGYDYYKKNRLNRARRELDKAIEIHPENYEAYFWRARTLIKMEKHDDAISDLKKVIDLKPAYSPAYDNLGWLLMLGGNYKESLSYLNRSLELKRDNGWAYYMRGRIYFEMGNRIAALENARAACRLGYKEACQDVQRYE